jgi:hypothetical protein
MNARQRPLHQALADYLDLRRALGVEIAAAGGLLHQYLGWFDEHGLDTITDVPAMMPRLSTYLGHSDPTHSCLLRF